ncbi:MAG TPA: SoxY-related AACIE arm protein [Casimicrobiaceae bacterium]|jgi:sulfur-oxidizing protein SoxY
MRATRRRFLAAGAGLGAALVVRPAAASPEDLAAAIAAYTGGAKVAPGRVTLEIAKLVDNGNAVPVTVSVQSPMTGADHVKAIAIFNERNPERDVARFALGPRSGRAKVETRIRLATSQKVTAVATMSDGSFWSDTIDVVVVLAACLEGDI